MSEPLNENLKLEFVQRTAEAWAETKANGGDNVDWITSVIEEGVDEVQTMAGLINAPLDLTSLWLVGVVITLVNDVDSTLPSIHEARRAALNAGLLDGVAAADFLLGELCRRLLEKGL